MVITDDFKVFADKYHNMQPTPNIIKKLEEKNEECWNCDKALFDADEDWIIDESCTWVPWRFIAICNDCWDELSCVECEERYKEEDCDGMLVMCHECQAEAEAEVKARDNK